MTDGGTEGETDRPSYRDARTHLKTKFHDANQNLMQVDLIKIRHLMHIFFTVFVEKMSYLHSVDSLISQTKFASL